MTHHADEHPETATCGTNDALTATLQSLGRWDHPSPQPALWEKAIEQCDRAKSAGSASLNSASIFTRVLRWPVPKAMAAGLAVVIGLGIVATVLFNTGSARIQLTKAQSNPAVVGTPGLVAADRNDRQFQYPNDNLIAPSASSAPGAGVGGGGIL